MGKQRQLARPYETIAHLTSVLLVYSKGTMMNAVKQSGGGPADKVMAFGPEGQGFESSHSRSNTPSGSSAHSSPFPEKGCTPLFY